VKICGITLLDQAVEISSLGVDALGFISYPPSPRYIEPTKIKEIISQIPSLVKTIGVFVDEELVKIKEIVEKTRLDLVQLHGDESPEYCQTLTTLKIPWIKAFRVRKQLNLELLNRYKSRNFLLDTWSAEEYGGSGKVFDWSLAQPAAERFNIILAGGINHENVTDAIQQVKPYALDISSGVESEPGIKSMDKVRTLLRKIHSIP
jgi:phosphoribosylanthranilate isomerase